MFNKVFCIGFNKTGTSSMHRLFTELGLVSFHGYYSHIPVTDPLYAAYQCFSDGDQHDFGLLDRTFPGSRFILTTRRLGDWLASRIRHVELRRSFGATGPMREEYEADPRAAVRSWIERRLSYHRRVADYFASRPGTLLVVDICSGADPIASAATIAAFLGLPLPAGLSLPHENAQRSRAVRDKAEIRGEVQAALADLTLPAEWLEARFP
jgi:hypothetical protein